jgi:hypothetical protein
VRASLTPTRATHARAADPEVLASFGFIPAAGGRYELPSELQAAFTRAWRSARSRWHSARSAASYGAFAGLLVELTRAHAARLCSGPAAGVHLAAGDHGDGVPGAPLLVVAPLGASAAAAAASPAAPPRPETEREAAEMLEAVEQFCRLFARATGTHPFFGGLRVALEATLGSADCAAWCLQDAVFVETGGPTFSRAAAELLIRSLGCSVDVGVNSVRSLRVLPERSVSCPHPPPQPLPDGSPAPGASGSERVWLVGRGLSDARIRCILRALPRAAALGGLHSGRLGRRETELSPALQPLSRRVNASGAQDAPAAGGGGSGSRFRLCC